MTRRFFRLAAAGLIVAAAAGPAPAQEAGVPPTSPFRGSVPQGTATAEPLRLTLEATPSIGRSSSTSGCCCRKRRCSRRAAPAGGRCPTCCPRWRHARRAAPGDRPRGLRLPGPGSDCRARSTSSTRASALSQPVDRSARLHDARPPSYEERAAQRHRARPASWSCWCRSTSISKRSPLPAASTSSAHSSRPRGAAGAGPGPEGLGAGRRHRRAAGRRRRCRRCASGGWRAENAAAKAKLRLARAIGLPPGQAVILADAIPYEPLAAVTLEEALRDAYEHRPDYLAAQDRLSAAESGERPPTPSCCRPALRRRLRHHRPDGRRRASRPNASPRRCACRSSRAARPRRPHRGRGAAPAAARRSRGPARPHRPRGARSDARRRRGGAGTGGRRRHRGARHAAARAGPRPVQRRRGRATSKSRRRRKRWPAPPIPASTCSIGHNVSKAALARAVGTRRTGREAYIGRMK